MSSPVVVFRNPLNGSQWSASGSNIALLTSWGWVPVDAPIPASYDPFPGYLTESEAAQAVEDGTGLLGTSLVNSAALRAASVAAVQEAIADGEIEAGTPAGSLVKALERVRSLGASAVVTNRNPWPDGVSSGTITEGNYRSRYRVTVDAHNLVLVFANAYTAEAAAVPNPVTVRAGLEMPDGTVRPVFFRGSRDGVMEPGAMLVSDPIPGRVTAGQFVYARCHPKVTAGGRWPISQPRRTQWAEGGSTATDTTDMTLTGTIGTASVFLFQPQVILGTTADPAPVTVAVVGDSISDGSGDSITDGANHVGYAERAIGGNFGLVRISNPGETTAEFIASPGPQLRAILAGHCTHAIVHYGINDLNATSAVTLQQLKDRLVTAWQILANMGVTVFATTLMPRTTSTDAWATTANQTLVFDAGEELIRTQINDWIRTKPAPVSAVFDTADAVETARNSGIWKAGHTTDGTHPSTAGATAAAAVVDLAAFTQ